MATCSIWRGRLKPAARRVFLTTAAAALLLLHGVAATAGISERWGGWGLGVSPFAQSDWALSTATESNPYNEHALSTKGNEWNMFAFRAESLFDLDAGSDAAAPFGLDSIRIFLHPRLYSEIVPEVDDHVPEVDFMGGFDGRRYPGNGWLGEVTGTHEYTLDTVEAYAELRRGGLRVRLGKQQIAWGTSIFLRSLDSVDSLDLRRHVIIDEAANEYSDTRISEWTAAVTYSLPVAPPGVSDITINGFVSPDFQPFILPAKGSPYSVLPSETILDDGKSIANAHRKLVYGGVLKWSALGFDWALHALSEPQGLGVFTLTPAPPLNLTPAALAGAGLPPGLVGVLSGALPPVPGQTLTTPFVLDPANGFTSFADVAHQIKIARLNLAKVLLTIQNPPFNVPAAFANSPALLDAFLASFPVDSHASRLFPRENLIGGSVSYYIQPVMEFPGAYWLNGNLVRYEFTYTPNRAFTDSGLGKPKRMGELNCALEMEKELKLFTSLGSAYTVLEYWYKSRGDFFERYVPSEGRKDFNLIAFAMLQNLRGSRFRFDTVVALDVAGGSWIQTGLQWKPRGYFEGDLYYNDFQGGKHDIFGPIKSWDEVFLKMTFKL